MLAFSRSPCTIYWIWRVLNGRGAARVVFEHQGKARRKEDVAVLGAFEGKIWGPRASPGPTRRGAGENQLRFQVRLDPKRESRKSSGSPPDAETWFASVVGQIKPLQGHSDPIADVREVASMEGRDRVESLGGLEVAAAQEKD